MSAPDLLDIGFANADPAVTAADVKAAGARAVGLYPINLSAPGTVVSADYARAVAAAGVQVVPIITPGQNPPPVSGVPDALKAWGQLNVDNAVVFDIEQWGIDTPPLDWVVRLRDTLNAAAYNTWIYTNIAIYEVATWWAVDWNHGDQAVIPAGAVAVQFGIPWVGSKGNSYDQSYLLPSVLRDPPKPRRPRMIIFTADAQPALLVVNGVAVGIPSQSDEAALIAAGVPVAAVSGQLYSSVFTASAPQLQKAAGSTVKLVPSGSISIAAQ